MTARESDGERSYAAVLNGVGRRVGALYEEMPELPVSGMSDPVEIRRRLEARFEFRAPRTEESLVAEVTELLREASVQVTHPRYFGLFNPTPRPITVASDALTAIFNPQLAVWDHAPAANEMEAHVLGYLAGKVGLDPETAHASFTSGGQEANHTAVIAALASAFPAVTRDGLRALPRDPVLYVSRDGHHSVDKAASATGLGHAAVRRVEVDDGRRMDPDALRRRVTWDAHKWLWAPVGTGMFFCGDREAVERAFSLKAGYVPPGTAGTEDRMTSTLQWSRRFIGLRVFMTLAELGADGVEELIDRQAAVGDLLRERLHAAGWRVVNQSRLPLVCFTHELIERGVTSAPAVARRVCDSGMAWISSLEMEAGRDVLRACVTSYRTDAEDVGMLVEALNEALGRR